MQTLTSRSYFTPRAYQKDFFDAMKEKKRAFLLYHRRAGKDIACWNFLIKNACEKVGIYYYTLPTYSQAKKVIWDGITEAGLRIIDYVPREFIDGKPNQTEMKIRLQNGSLIQVIGSDNFDSIRGTNPIGVVFSEFALQDPRIWTEIISPILVKNKGWAVFNTTPMGHNFAYDLWMGCQDSPHWYTQKLTIDDTGLITHDEIDRERKEGKSEEIIQQEYFVSFSRGIDGSYYGKLVERARQELRIGTVDYEPTSCVNTYWDIGFGDSTSVIWAQQVGTQFKVLDYYENNNEGIEHYVKVVNSKSYVYGKHYMPHDAASGHISSGKTVQKVASDLGLQSTVLPKDPFEVGVDAGRALLCTAYFDGTRCKGLIKALENYHKKYNDKMGCYSDSPTHDQWSHGADAWRYAAMARQHYGFGGNSAVSSEKIKEYRLKHLGY